MVDFDTAGCSNNEIIVARAQVTLGNRVYATPDIRSIAVVRQRGQAKSQAKCQVFVPEGEVEATGGGLLIITFWGNLVFTGVAKRVVVSPSFRCQGESIVEITGEDFMYKLDNYSYTRRQKQEGLPPLAIITSKKDTPERGFDTLPLYIHSQDRGFSDMETIAPDTNPRNMSRLASYSNQTNHGPNHPTTKNARPLSDPRGGAATGGAGIHDHSSIAELGPAHAVFGAR